MKRYGTIWVCVDCMHHHANGECGSCHSDYGHGTEPLSAIGDGFDISMGMLYAEHCCDAHDGPGDDCDCECDTFSTSRCEGCGSYLHGERHAMTLFKL